MGMGWIRKNRNRRALIPAFVAVFFVSQVFACCFVNHRLIGFIAAFAKSHVASEPEHACCHKQTAEAPQTNHCKPDSQGCCIQTAAATSPLLAMAPEAPSLAAAPVARMPVVIGIPTALPTPRDLHDTPSPPPYLSHLQLLI